MMATELEEAGEEHEGDEKAKKRAEKRVRAKYHRTHLLLRPLLSDPRFARDLSQIAHFGSFVYVEPTVDTNRHGPMSTQIKLQRTAIEFVPNNQAVTRIRNYIAGLVRSLGIDVATARGTSNAGSPVKATIQPSRYSLARYPHDDIVVPQNLRLDAVGNLPMIRDMLGIIDDHPHVFG